VVAIKIETTSPTSKPDFDEVLKGRPLAVEVPLTEDIEGLPVPLMGMVDLVTGDMVAVDFKSAATTPNAKQAAFDHEIQMVVYQLLIERADGRTPKSLDLIFLVKNQPSRRHPRSRPLAASHSARGSLRQRLHAPCVDDNATSVAHNIVLADHYVLQPLERDIIVAFFDAEEQPFFLGKTMGAYRFVEDYWEDIDFAVVIVTDLVGHDAEPADLGLPQSAAIAIPHLKNLIAVMGSETNGTFPADADRSPADPFETEMQMIRKAIGPALPIAMKYFCIDMPKSREELT